MILDLHGMGLCRGRVLGQAGEPGRAILEACTRDDLVRSLLLLRDLHPQGRKLVPSRSSPSSSRSCSSTGPI